jgi:uncharacterized membrane protein YwaF
MQYLNQDGTWNTEIECPGAMRSVGSLHIESILFQALIHGIYFFPAALNEPNMKVFGIVTLVALLKLLRVSIEPLSSRNTVRTGLPFVKGWKPK